MKTKLFILLIILCSNAVHAQKTSGKYAIIEFAGENNSYSRTYLGKVKKGDAYQLNSYLQQTKTVDKNDRTTEQKNTPAKYRSSNKKESTPNLSKSYELNEKKLKKNKTRYHKKYLKKKEKAFTKKKNKEAPTTQRNTKKATKVKPVKKTILSKKYKIKGKRLKAGSKLKYNEGPISLIIKYTIKSNSTIKTYVTSVNSRVMAGEKYELKYYGNDSKRKYFIVRSQ